MYHQAKRIISARENGLKPRQLFFSNEGNGHEQLLQIDGVQVPTYDSFSLPAPAKVFPSGNSQTLNTQDDLVLHLKKQLDEEHRVRRSHAMQLRGEIRELEKENAMKAREIARLRLQKKQLEEKNTPAANTMDLIVPKSMKVQQVLNFFSYGSHLEKKDIESTEGFELLLAPWIRQGCGE